jgi:hypothetical protein
MTEDMADLAADLGGEYDGWETEVVRSSPNQTYVRVRKTLEKSCLSALDEGKAPPIYSPTFATGRRARPKRCLKQV